MRSLIFFSTFLLLLQALPAHAYIGPGAGAGAIAVVVGVLASMFLAFFAIVWFPIKRLIQGNAKPKDDESDEAAPDAEE